MLSDFAKLHIYAYFGKYEIFYDLYKKLRDPESEYYTFLFYKTNNLSYLNQCVVIGCRYNIKFAERMYKEFDFDLPFQVRQGITDSYILHGREIEKDMVEPYNVLYPNKINVESYSKNYYAIREAIVFYGRKDLIDDTFEQELLNIYNDLYVKKDVSYKTELFIRNRVCPGYNAVHEYNTLEDDFFRMYYSDFHERLVNDICKTDFESAVCDYYINNKDELPDTEYDINSVNFNTLDAIYFYINGKNTSECENRFRNCNFFKDDKTFDLHRPIFYKGSKNISVGEVIILSHFSINMTVKSEFLSTIRDQCLHRSGFKKEFKVGLYFF